MSSSIRIPAPLRGFTRGRDEIEVRAGTVRQALEALEREHEGFLRHILDESGDVRRFVNVFVDSTNIRSLSGLDSTVESGSVISIVPAVAGGAR